MGTRFEKFDLGRAMARILNIKGNSNGPTMLEDSDVKVVAPLDMGWLGYTSWALNFSKVVDSPGNGTFAWPIVGDQPQGFSLAFAADQRVLDTRGLEAVILGLQVELIYDAAGALADNGKEIEAFLRRWDSTYSRVANESTWFPAFTVVTARLNYKLSLPMQSMLQAVSATPTFQIASVSRGNIWIPAGTGIDLVIDRRDGTDFPANTEFNFSAFGVLSPKGFRPPGL